MSRRSPVLPQARALLQRIARSTLVRDVSQLTLMRGVTLAASIVQALVVARLLGPEAYGTAALVMSVPGTAYAFLDFRSPDASIKYLAEFDRNGDGPRALAVCKAMYLIDLAASGAALVLSMAISSWAAAHVVHHQALAWLIVAFAAAYPLRSLAGTAKAVLATAGRFDLYSWIQGGSGLLSSAVVVTAAFTGFGVPGVVLGTAGVAALEGVVTSVVATRIGRRRWGGAWLSARLGALRGWRRAMGVFLFYSNGSVMVGLLVKQFDVLALGYLRNPHEAGLYEIARKVAAVVGYLVMPLQGVVYPRLAQLWGDSSRWRRQVRRVALGGGLPLGAVVLVGLPLLEPATRLLFGDAYLPSVPASQWLLASSAVWLALFWLRPAYFSADRIRAWFGGYVVYALVFVAMLYPVIGTFGVLGLAVLRACSTIAFHLAMLVALLRFMESASLGERDDSGAAVHVPVSPDPEGRGRVLGAESNPAVGHGVSRPPFSDEAGA
jgi:O-antigen/teichoic acid export membrane protein